MQTPSIHAVSPEGWAHLQHIARTTFIETFAEQNDPESMRLYMGTQLSAHQLWKLSEFTSRQSIMEWVWGNLY